MECFSSKRLASLGYDDYYEDVFMKGRGKHVGTEKIENGIVADVYSYGNGETILSYSVNENYHVIEDPTENCAEVLIETDDFIIWYFYNCYYTKIPASLTREELWSFGVKPFVPEEDTTNRDLSDTLVRIHEGLTYAEITEIFGDPGEPEDERGYVSSCKWVLPDKGMVHVTFDENEIASNMFYTPG